MTDTTLALDDIALGDPSFWATPQDVRDAAFRTLRHLAPVRFFDEPLSIVPGAKRGPGFWALTRYDDVWAVSRNPRVFSSASGTSIVDIPESLIETLGSMLNMDDPQHFRLRSLVAKAFTPREVARVEASVRSIAKEVVDEVLTTHNGSCDLVDAISAPFPVRVICRMMGVPREDEGRIVAWTNAILGVGDPELVPSFAEFTTALMEMAAYFAALGEEKRAEPGDDLTSILMHAEIDGDRLSSRDFASFMILLGAAGNETTRTAISHGVHLLSRYPQQRAAWFDDFEAVTPTAVEEIVRYATPVIHFRRTATEDTEVRGIPIAAGEKVVLWYSSANRDEEKWADPDVFDVRRPTTPQHVGFGAGGPHFCLGANLARRELGVIFDEIRRRMPDLHTTAEPAYLRSSFIHGIKRVPCAWSTA